MLWECTAYSSSRASFTEKLQELLGDSYADFDLLNNVEKTSYVLLRVSSVLLLLVLRFFMRGLKINYFSLCCSDCRALERMILGTSTNPTYC